MYHRPQEESVWQIVAATWKQILQVLVFPTSEKFWMAMLCEMVGKNYRLAYQVGMDINI